MQTLVAIVFGKRSPLIPLKKGDFVLSFQSLVRDVGGMHNKVEEQLFSPLFLRGVGGDLFQEVKSVTPV
jgi:hypothetical protein